jgi:hypothetical protein
VPLLTHIESALPESGRGPLRNGGEPLPYETVQAPNEIRFAPGARDTIMSSERTNAPLEAAAAVVNLANRHPDSRRVSNVITRLRKLEGTEHIDRFLGSIFEARVVDRARLVELARWLCRNGTQVPEVKAGIALLGTAGTPDDAALILKLGLFEELTLYAVVGVQDLLVDAESAIFDLAQQVTGWGRIQAIRRLAGTQHPAIRSWLVRGGAANTIGLGEIAYVAATTGGLREALEDEFDEDLLDPASDLLSALAIGGPAEDMSDYEESAAAIRAYLLRVTTAPATRQRIYALLELEQYLADDERAKPYIQPTDRGELLQAVSTLLADVRWADYCRRTLSSDDLTEVKRVSDAAERFDIDPRPVLEAWLERTPTDSYLWYYLALRADREAMLRLLALAEAVLPIQDLSTGPDDHFGLGPDYAVEKCVEPLVFKLAQFPGDGWSIVKPCLNNRVVRMRNGALNALEAWPRTLWPGDAVEALRTLQFREPDRQVRGRIGQLLKN